jgi:hypothetical protein
MTCGLCGQAQKDGFRNDIHCLGIETVDECPTGEVGKLHKKLAGFKWLLDRFLPVAGNGLGAWQPDAFRLVFETYAVPQGQRPVLADFLLVVLKTIQEVRGRKQDEDQGGSVEERQAAILGMLPRK